MAIARTPVAPASKPALVDDKTIDALISKGGSSTFAQEAATFDEEDKIKTVLVRTYESQVTEIDRFLAQIPKRDRLSRNAFIVEAIKEKMHRDKSKRK